MSWSPQMYEIYGLDPETVIEDPRHVLRFVHPDDGADVEAGLQTMVEGGPAFDHVHRITAADGARARRPRDRSPRPAARGRVLRDRAGRHRAAPAARARRAVHDRLRRLAAGHGPADRGRRDPAGQRQPRADARLRRARASSSGSPGWRSCTRTTCAKLAGMGAALAHGRPDRHPGALPAQQRRAESTGCRPPSPSASRPGVPPTIFSQILDVSERVRVEHDLAESEARYRRILETTLEGVWTLDADDVTTFANRAMAEILDTEPAALLGRPLSDFLEGTADLRHGGHHELSLHTVTGRPVWALVAANPMLDGDGNYLGALAMVTDISDRKAMEVRLQHLADHDHLTGIFNRRRLLEELDEQLRMAARTGRGGAALVVDLDHFKFINDTHGHVAGDTILRTVGEVLRMRLRSTDVVARLGGDEFALVLAGGVGRAGDGDRAGAARAARRARLADRGQHRRGHLHRRRGADRRRDPGVRRHRAVRGQGARRRAGAALHRPGDGRAALGAADPDGPGGGPAGAARAADPRPAHGPGGQARTAGADARRRRRADRAGRVPADRRALRADPRDRRLGHPPRPDAWPPRDAR